MRLIGRVVRGRPARSDFSPSVGFPAWM